MAFLALLCVLAPQGYRPQCLRKPSSVHADLGRHRRRCRQPHVLPHAVIAAPERAGLAGVVAASLRRQARTVDGNLRLHHLALLAAIPPLDGVNLARKRIQSGALADLAEQGQLVRVAALRHRAGDEGHRVIRHLRKRHVSLLVVLQSGRCGQVTIPDIDTMSTGI